MFSDIYKIKLIDDFAYEVEGKVINSFRIVFEKSLLSEYLNTRLLVRDE